MRPPADPVVIVGLGQMGATFAHGLLRLGHTVRPVIRASDPRAVASELPAPALVLVAVGEADLHPTLADMPAAWRGRIALLQNELLPEDWRRHAIERPTVAVVWFEKKKDKPLHVVLPTPVAGPAAPLLVEALGAIDVPAVEIEAERLLFELVKKNLYILCSNIAGLEVGGSVGELWASHRDLAADVAAEVIAIEAWRAGQPLPQRELMEEMARAFEADPEHGCTGRSAPQRLARALSRAKEAGLPVPTLSRIAANHA